MAKVTSKLQVTVPKALAEQYGIRPGDEIEWKPGGDAIRVEIPGRVPASLTIAERLALFDATTRRLDRRRRANRGRRLRDRGWTRQDLYDDRGLPR